MGKNNVKKFSIYSILFMILLITPLHVEAVAKTPAKVSSVNAESVNHNSVKISWKKTKNAKKYQIFRAPDKRGVYRKIKTTTELSFTNAGLTTGKTYYYKVRGVNGLKKGKLSDTKYTAPKLSKVSITEVAKGENSITLTWQKVAGTTEYRIYRSSTEDGPYTNIASTGEISYTDEELTRNTEYYYKVRACKKVGSSYKYGEYSVVECVKTDDHVLVETITPPTDTEMGYTTYTCDTCGYSEVRDYVKQLYEDYVIEEARRVSGLVNEVADDENLNFVLCSDMHHPSEGELEAYIVEQMNASNLHAGQAMGLIADEVALDFFGALGDFAWGGSGTTIEQGKASILEGLAYLEKIRMKTNSVLLPGNHDSLLYSYAQNDFYLSDEEVTSLLGDYKYIDFEKEKIRVIFLNTSETEAMNGIELSSGTGGEGVTAEQLQWFAESLDLSEKPDAKEWGTIIVSHHPLDWGYVMPAANCLQAYLEGGEFHVQHKGMNIRYNYAGKNTATVIAQFHGHLHNYKVDNIHYKKEGKILKTNIKRIGIPNTNYYRNNTYGNNIGSEYHGIEYGEMVNYDKISNSAKDTAFNVISIDKEQKKIYAYCYGAGIDREISYDTKD